MEESEDDGVVLYLQITLIFRYSDDCHDKINGAQKALFLFLDRCHCERVMLGTGQFCPIKIYFTNKEIA